MYVCNDNVTFKTNQQLLMVSVEVDSVSESSNIVCVVRNGCFVAAKTLVAVRERALRMPVFVFKIFDTFNSRKTHTKTRASI